MRRRWPCGCGCAKHVITKKIYLSSHGPTNCWAIIDSSAFAQKGDRRDPQPQVATEGAVPGQFFGLDLGVTGCSASTQVRCSPCTRGSFGTSLSMSSADTLSPAQDFAGRAGEGGEAGGDCSTDFSLVRGRSLLVGLGGIGCSASTQSRCSPCTRGDGDDGSGAAESSPRFRKHSMVRD